MSHRLTVSISVFPGIVAGLNTSNSAVSDGRSRIPGPFRQVFPRQTLVLLSVAIGAATPSG